ncbi:MAG: methyltransferase domain-containing protein [Verrucomicrobiia bacterium]
MDKPYKMYRDYGWINNKTHAHNYILPVILKVIANTKISKNSLILDAGCGGGYVLNELFKKGYKNIYGFDLSESGIKIARKEYAEINDRFEKHDCYLENLPSSFPKANYDIVLSVEVIEHLYDPKLYLRNINYWLKKDGILIITTPYHGYIKNLVLSVFNAWDKHFTVNWDGGHIKYFSKKTLSAMLTENGFSVLRFHGSGRVPFLWKSMIIVARKI